MVPRRFFVFSLSFLHKLFFFEQTVFLSSPLIFVKTFFPPPRKIDFTIQKRAAENPEGTDSRDIGAAKPFEPFVGFSEEPDPRGSYIYFVKTGDFYPLELQSGEKK